MKMFFVLMALGLNCTAFAAGNPEINCFFLYQNTDGKFVTFETRTQPVVWGTQASYNLSYKDTLGETKVRADIKTIPFDHAPMSITFFGANGALPISANSDMKPNNLNMNQANLVLNIGIPPMQMNGEIVNKFYASCLITN